IQGDPMRRAHQLALISVCGLAAGAALAQPCGNPWSQGPVAGPSARTYVQGAYDSARDRVVLVGGVNGNTYFNDTWEWEAAGPAGGGSWTRRATTGPTAGAQAGLAYDSARKKTVLFGGLNSGNTYTQTWEWDGATWTQVTTPVSPPPMVGKLLAYDAS